MSKQMITILIVVMLPAGMVAGQPSNSIFRRSAQAMQSRNMRGMGQSGGGFGANTYNASMLSGPLQITMKNASWISVSKPRQKNFLVHDLVTIVVHEVSQHKTNTKTDAERDYSLSAALTDWISLSGGNLRPDQQALGDPQIGFEFEKELKSKAKVERQDTVTARIHAEVIDVLPNGNLVLEATHRVVTDEEEMMITLTGTCRSKDIDGVTNSIISTQLAQLDLQKHHKGIARDAGKRGFISGLLDFILPF